MLYLALQSRRCLHLKHHQPMLLRPGRTLAAPFAAFLLPFELSFGSNRLCTQSLTDDNIQQAGGEQQDGARYIVVGFSCVVVSHPVA